MFRFWKFLICCAFYAWSNRNAQMKKRENWKKWATTDINAPNGSRDIPYEVSNYIKMRLKSQQLLYEVKNLWLRYGIYIYIYIYIYRSCTGLVSRDKIPQVFTRFNLSPHSPPPFGVVLTRFGSLISLYVPLGHQSDSALWLQLCNIWASWGFCSRWHYHHLEWCV